MDVKVGAFVIAKTIASRRSEKGFYRESNRRSKFVSKDRIYIMLHTLVWPFRTKQYLLD